MANRALLLSAQVNGIDSHETIMHLSQLGILYSELGQNHIALEYFHTSQYFLQLIAGDHHPEIANIYMRLAALYEKVNDIDSSLQCLFRSRVYTGDLLKSCMLTISIASLYYANGMIHEAVNTQKNGYKILKELVKKDDERLIEVKNNLELYIRSSVNIPLASLASSAAGGRNLDNRPTNVGVGSPYSRDGLDDEGDGTNGVMMSGSQMNRNETAAGSSSPEIDKEHDGQKSGNKKKKTNKKPNKGKK
jgi:tetratricopeptide (TPR) repeat protein